MYVCIYVCVINNYCTFIGLFYYTLGNIHPAHRSQLKAIQLLAIVKRPVIIKYGINAILAPIMEEVLQLDQDGGYQFTVLGEKRSFAGTIAFVSGDNLASQELGGFKVGPGSHLKCRECLGATQEIKTKVYAYNNYLFAIAA